MSDQKKHSFCLSTLEIKRCCYHFKYKFFGLAIHDTWMTSFRRVQRQKTLESYLGGLRRLDKWGSNTAWEENQKIYVIFVFLIFDSLSLCFSSLCHWCICKDETQCMAIVLILRLDIKDLCIHNIPCQSLFNQFILATLFRNCTAPLKSVQSKYLSQLCAMYLTIICQAIELRWAGGNYSLNFHLYIWTCSPGNCLQNGANFSHGLEEKAKKFTLWCVNFAVWIFDMFLVEGAVMF